MKHESARVIAKSGNWDVRSEFRMHLFAAGFICLNPVPPCN